MKGFLLSLPILHGSLAGDLGGAWGSLFLAHHEGHGRKAGGRDTEMIMLMLRCRNLSLLFFSLIIRFWFYLYLSYCLCPVSTFSVLCRYSLSPVSVQTFFFLLFPSLWMLRVQDLQLRYFLKFIFFFRRRLFMVYYLAHSYTSFHFVVFCFFFFLFIIRMLSYLYHTKLSFLYNNTLVLL